MEAVIIWAIAIQTVRHLASRRRSPADSASLVQVVTLSLGALAQSPDVRPRIDLLVGVDGLGRWLAFSLVLCSMAAFWLVVAHVTRHPDDRPPRVLIRVLGVSGAITAMGVLFLSSGTRDDVGASFLAVYGDVLSIVGGYLVFLGYITVVLVATLRAAWRYTKYARQRYLRLGMRLLVAGDLCGLVYTLYLGATVLTSHLSLPLPPGATTYAATYLGFGAVTLILAGPTISVWGPRLTAPLRTLAQRRALRRLHPLWLALTTAMPYLRRQPSRTLGDAVGYRLYRRVIEIRDGLLILDPYLGRRAERRPTTDIAADTAAHARAIAAALHAFSLGEDSRDAASDRTADDDHPGTVQEADGHVDAVSAPTVPLMRDEVAYLTRLSHAYARLDKGE